MEDSSLQEKQDPALHHPVQDDAAQPVTTEAGAHPQASAFAKEDTKPKRTFGLKLFDFFLYPVLTNTVVFAVSVAATYLTMYGNKTGGRVGQWFYNRGDAFKNFAMKHGVGEKQADAAKMVAFSFIDGSVMAPVVKIIEDDREKIAHKIDKCLGTEPEDKSVYEAEPKQNWGSVLGGRIAALSIVLPTAVVLGKFGTKNSQFLWSKEKENPGFNSLNDHLFNNPGKKVGEIIEKKPGLAKYFGKLNIPVISAVGFFEAFYTSLCTTVLYFASRAIAKPGSKEKIPTQKPDSVEPVPMTNAQAAPGPMQMEHYGNRPQPTLAADGATRKYFATLQESPFHTLDGQDQGARPSL